jgi:hypothetical protein
MNMRAVHDISLREIYSYGQLTEPARRRVYMSIVRQLGGWHCRFHQDDLAKTPISRRFVFRDADKIYEAARRGHGFTGMESCQALDEAVARGRGGIWLKLAEHQYRALRRKS